MAPLPAGEEGCGLRWDVTSVAPPPSGEEGLWSVGGSALPFLSRMSCHVNHAPRLKMTKKLLYTLKTSVRAEWLQSCLTLCSPLDCSRLVPLSVGFSGRTVEWTVMPSNRGSSQLSDQTSHALAGGFFTPSTTWKPTLSHSWGQRTLPHSPSWPRHTGTSTSSFFSLQETKTVTSGFLGGASSKAHA